MRCIDIRLIGRVGRAGAFALLGAAILISAIRFHQEKPTPVLPPLSVPPPVAQADTSLDATLERCRAIAQPEDVDAACRAAWAEVRRRFFAPHEADNAHDVQGTNEMRP